MATQYLATEQHPGPCYQEGVDDDGSYLKLLQEVTHYPNDYGHGPSDTVNTLPPLQNGPLLSRLDIGPLSALAGSPLLEPSLPLGLSLLDQDFFVERPSFTEGSSPLPPVKPLHNFHGPVLTTVAPGSSQEQHWFTNDQHASSWGSLPSSLPNQGGQVYHYSFPLDGLSHYDQDFPVERPFFPQGSSPFPPMKPLPYIHGPVWTTVALGSSLEQQWRRCTNNQHASSWCSLPSPLPDQGGQLYHSSFPQDAPSWGPVSSPLPIQGGQLHHSSSLQKSPRHPGAHLIPERPSTTGSTLEPSLRPNLNIPSCAPASEQACQEAYEAYSEYILADIVALQKQTIDFRTTTVPTDKGSIRHAPPREALRGVDRLVDLAKNGPGISSLYSARPNEEISLPNLTKARHHVTVISTTSSQVTPSDKVLKKFWCADCDIGFGQRQALNRHEREKHGPRNICHLCNYEWSPARRYKFTRHMKQHHLGSYSPNARNGLAMVTPSDLRHRSPMPSWPDPHKWFPSLM